MGTDSVAGDNFGWCVAMTPDGNAFITGARDDDNGANVNQGSAYIYKWTGSWVQSKYIAPDGAANDSFGYSVALNSKGTIAIIGAILDDTHRFTDMGSAWIFGID